MQVELVGSVLSPFVRKARVVLEEKGVSYAHQDLVPFLAPASFSEISPLRRIPVLRDPAVDPKWTLADSSAICAYLERKYPSPALYPAEPALYGQALWFEEYADTDFSHTIGQKIFGPVVVQGMLGNQPDHAAVQRAVDEELPPYFDYFESKLGENEFFVGPGLSIADISVAVHLQNLLHAGFSLSKDKYPSLARFAAQVLSRKSFQKCRDEERKILQRASEATTPEKRPPGPERC